MASNSSSIDTSIATGDSASASSEFIVDDENKNWMMTALSLNVIKRAVTPDIKAAVETFHDKLKTTHPPVCGACSTSNMKFDSKNKTWSLDTQCIECSSWLKDIIDQHVQRENQRFVYKNNSDLKKWTSYSWEIAKIYMSRGQKADNISPETSDCAALISLMRYCRFISSKFGGKQNVLENLLTIGNKIFHSDSLRMDDQVRIDIIIELMKHLETLFPDDSKKSFVAELEMLKDAKVCFSPGELYEEQLEALKTRLSELEEKVQNKEMHESVLDETLETVKRLEPNVTKCLERMDQMSLDNLSRDRKMEELDSKITKSTAVAYPNKVQSVNDCRVLMANIGNVNIGSNNTTHIHNFPQMAIGHYPKAAIGHPPQGDIGHSPQKAVGHSPQKAIGHSPQKAIGHSPQKAIGHVQDSGAKTRPVKLNVKKRQVNSSDIDLVSDNLGHEWQRLGRKLNLSDSDLDSLDHDFQSSGTREIIHQMLLMWKEKTGDNATLKVLTESLLVIKEDRIARMLARK